jgi:hypothetical protein
MATQDSEGSIRFTRSTASTQVSALITPRHRPSAALDSLSRAIGMHRASAYLRATLKVMESLRRAERLREMQAANHRRLAERGVAVADLPDLIREEYKGSGE